MDPFPVAVAIMCSLGLAGVALSVVAIYQTRCMTRFLERRIRARQARLEAAFEASEETVKGLATEMHQIQEQSCVTQPAASRSGLNLSTRSQALRMHRRGGSPSQIAATLQAPVQEIELLLKVHRIVLNNLVVTAKPEAPIERTAWQRAAGPP